MVLPGTSRCVSCQSTIDRDYDARRPTASARGYTSRGHRRFRRRVLARDRLCVICAAAGRLTVATVADHWPLGRDVLITRGMDPDDPDNGRGLCASCHGKETSVNQPGGWNAR